MLFSFLFFFCAERHPVPKARFTWPHKNDTVFDLADPKSAARLAYFVDNFKMPDGSMRAGVQFSSCPHTEGVAQLVVNGEVKAETSYPDVSVSLAEFENGEHEAFVVLMDEAVRRDCIALHHLVADFRERRLRDRRRCHL